MAQETRKQPVQEVFESELVYTQDRGEIQVTTGFAGRHESAGASVYQWPVQAEYGVTRRLQFGVEWEGPGRIAGDDQVSRHGFMDWHAGAKYSFMNIRNSNFHAAVAAKLGIPTGNVDGGFSEGFMEYEPSVMAARDFPRLRGAQVFFQTGVAFLQRVRRASDAVEEEPDAHEFHWSGGMFIPLHRVVGTAEFAWSTNRWNHGGQANELYVAPGAVWKAPGGWECGFGAAFGITPQADRWTFTMKLTREFETNGDEARKKR